MAREKNLTTNNEKMSRRNRNKGNNFQLAAKTSTKSPNNRLYPQLVDKTVTQTRQDIAKMTAARNAFFNADNPSVWLFYNLIDTILDDAHLTSQIENRVQDSLSATFNLKKKGADIDQELTDTWQNSELFNYLITEIINSRLQGNSLVELEWQQDGLNEPKLIANTIPRQNIIASKGWFLPDYNDDKKILYREMPEYGTWLLEFGKPKDMGLLNKAIPHVLFKKFATSCWSELCEIYGIPPRVYKTDAQDPAAVARGKKMMQDMGSAAWFIIDTTEEFEWAKGVDTNGDVYNNLIKLCENQNSLLISGAIIGQDTANGSYNKDESSQKMLSKLVLADMALVEMYMNSKVMPALARIGVIPANYVFAWEISEDLATLWKRTIEALNYFDIAPEWIKGKFGIEVTGKKQQTVPGNLSIAEGFFV